MDYNNLYNSTNLIYNVKTENGKLYQNTLHGEQHIGYTTEAYKELETALEQAISKCENYRSMLEENGLITKPKTQEDINNELFENNQKLMQSLDRLTGLVVNLENNYKELANEYSKYNTTKNEFTTRDVKQSKRSNKDSKQISE